MALELDLGTLQAGVDGWTLVLVGPVVADVVRLTWADGSADVAVRDAADLAGLLGTGTLTRVAPGPPHHREVAWWHRDTRALAVAGLDADVRGPVSPTSVFAVAEVATPQVSDHAALTSYVTAWLATALREGGDLLLEPVHGNEQPSPFVRCWTAEGRLFAKVFPVPAGPGWTPFADTDFALTAIDHDVADPYGQDPDALVGVAEAVSDAALGWGIGALGVVATLDLTAGNDTDQAGDTLTVESPRALVAMLEEWWAAHADRPDVTLGASSGLGRIAVQHPFVQIDVDVTANPAGVRFWLDRWYGSPHLALLPDPAQSPADVRREGRRCVVSVGQSLHAVAGCVLTATLTDDAPRDLQEWSEDPRTPWWLGPPPGRTDYTRPNWFRATLPYSLAVLDAVTAHLPSAAWEARTLRHLRVTARAGGERFDVAELDVRLGVAAAARDVASGAALTVPPISEPFLRRLSPGQFDALVDRVVALTERAVDEASGGSDGVLEVHFDDRVAVARTRRELLALGVPARAASLFAEVLVEAEERDLEDHLDFARTDVGVVLTWDGQPWLNAADAPEAGGLRRVAVELISAVLSRQQAQGS